MSDQNKVVAHFLNGTIVKGTTQDFFPNRPKFRIQSGKDAPVEISCRNLKAVFFVQDLNGNNERRDLRGFIDAPQETTHGKKIAVRFKDGELLCGYTLTYTPDRAGFFMFPSDRGSNNQRVYVLTAATVEVKAGPAADALAQKVLGNRAA
jgi:hypothetical protein